MADIVFWVISALTVMSAAFVVLNNEYQGSQDIALELFKHSMENLARYKIPRIIEFVMEMPRTASGKVRRIELRENEMSDQEEEEDRLNEYFFWNFPQLSSKK